ncbi:MAG: hypothetical protein O2945_21600, partial [Planctomycetota bacterium]|nr:hypothetical protein [Planctomycetota bacterium]
MPIRNVLTMLNAVSPQYVEGDQALLDKKIAGDWVFDPQALAEIERLLCAAADATPAAKTAAA